MNSIQEAKITRFAAYLPTVQTVSAEQYQSIYEANRDRIYTLAFWMSDNELVAEETLSRVFLRAFSMSDAPTSEMLDRALISELRETVAIGNLSLHCEQATEVLNIRSNTKRIFLERALVQLPATERLIFCMHDGE